MSEFNETFKELFDHFPWLKEPLESLKEDIKVFQKYNEDLRFRISWLETFTFKLLFFNNKILTQDQKDLDEYQALYRLIHQHIKRFNPDFFEEIVTTQRDWSEERILEFDIHPEREIEKLKKKFDLEDISKIITLDFIEKNFPEQLEIYKLLFEEDKP